MPAGAIVERGGRNVVFTVNEAATTVAEHSVEIGIVHGERVQIENPRLAGPVVVLGQHLLEDGYAVTITKPDRLADE